MNRTSSMPTPLAVTRFTNADDLMSNTNNYNNFSWKYALIVLNNFERTEKKLSNMQQKDKNKKL